MSNSDKNETTGAKMLGDQPCSFPPVAFAPVALVQSKDRDNKAG